ncbi:uncharacterized protein LOC112637668 [Camponotus floridanus]|uniref:uncharacterized protein LOC112637668 n=1 Tax=Camponotus floridanus TaxID=104421 RepID=UPI000DC66993|nr:uncharacterized protein LOC112637668 [Camponotus floridanus]
MTDNQLYVPFRNETLSTNSCEFSSRNAAFDLEIYGPYLDKIRELFVPSLEYRIHSLLEEFVYSEDSRWAVQFPYVKKFIDAIATWRGPLIKAAEYDIGTMEKAIKSAVKRVVKDDLIPCFLDSLTPYYRLNKICRELDALGIENNILRSLNVWNSVNEKKCHRADRDCFTNPDTMDCNSNSRDVTMSPCDAKGPTRCKKAIEAYEKSIEQPTTSENQQIVDTSQDFLQQTEDSSHNEVSQNDKSESVDEEPCDAAKSFAKRLKMIVRKMYPEDCSCPTLSGSILTCLALPCKPRDLIGRIFEADPCLTESCFIVMKRKFLISVHNVCSCLNDILGKLDSRFTKTLHLNCEIYPGYIRFRLKSSSVNKCLFVARISICQSVRRRTIVKVYVDRPNFVISICKSNLNTDAKRSKCFERYCDDDNDILARVEEESKELDGTCCSRLDPSVKDAAMNISDEAGNGNREGITCTITKCVSNCLQNFTTFSCNKSRENIAEEICDLTSQIDNLNERDGKTRKIPDSMEISCGNDAEKRGRKIIDSDNSVTIMNEEITRMIDDANCVCLSSENLAETNHEVENNFSNEDPDFSQCDRTRSSDKESNLGEQDKECNANTCSITSFVQNSEHDKQLVELNCNRFLDNDIRAIDEESENGSLNSAKAEIGCNSSRNVDFIDITVIDNIRFEESRDDRDAKIRSANHCKSSEASSKNNDSLTVSIQTPRLRVSSKGISVNVSYPPVWLASNDDESTSTKTPRRVETMDLSALIVPRKRRKILGNKRISHKTRGFIKPPRSLVSRCELRSNGNSESSDISTEEYLCMSRCCPSMSKFTASDRRGEFENSYNSTRLSKLCVSSSNDFRNVTSFPAIKYGAASRKDNVYSAKVPQAILVMTKFRDSIDRSVRRIKRLIHAKLRKILFNDGIKTNASGTFWKNEDTRGKTNGRCVRQSYSVTSCSTCNCCRHGCIPSSRESSNVILSIRRNRCGEEKDGRMKFHDRRLTGGSEILSTFRSIETSYDSLTPAVEDLKKHELSRSNRRERTERNIVKSSCNFSNYGTSVTISSQSAKVSGNNSKYLGRCTRKQRKETRDDKRVYEGIRNPDRWKETQRGCERRARTHRGVPEGIKYSSNESLGASSSSSQRGEVKNVYKQSRSDKSRAKNQQKDTDPSDNDRLRKKRVFGILTDICNDYTDDLDLDFKLQLLRYVELCRNIKCALLKTLQPDDDFYEIDTMSRARWRESLIDAIIS